MNDIVRKDMLSTLTKVIDILNSENVDSNLIKSISNSTIHNASVFQDENSISVAVVVYSIAKILERIGKVPVGITKALLNAKTLLGAGKFDDFDRALKEVVDKISESDSKIKLYIEKVIAQAQIKKGSKLFEHGLSVARAADILNISQWELMFYIGKTELTGQEKDGSFGKKRLNFARELFKVNP